MNSPKNPNLRNHLLAISASLLIGAGLMIIKFLAFYLTGSAAILSDALESIINVVAAGLALWSILLIPTGHAAYGLGFWAELGAALGRQAAPSGARRALADWAAGRPLHGMMSAPFAAYYAAAAVSVRLWARASRQPVSDIRVHRGYAGTDWRPGVSDIDLTAVWHDPGPEAEPDALMRWSHGYARLRRIFPMLSETVLADEESWRRYRCHGDFRARSSEVVSQEDRTRLSVDRWTEQLHGAVRLARAYLDEPAGPRRSRTATKSFLDVVRHGGKGAAPSREEALRGLGSGLAGATVLLFIVLMFVGASPGSTVTWHIAKAFS